MSDQNAALVPGQTILGRYSLKKLLGRGGFGVVWLAEDQDLRMEVALKFLSDLIASNPDAVEDLKRETRFSLRLTHPHIVRIYGFFQDSNFAGLSMEHVQGGTLIHIRAARGRRCFSLPDLAPWIVQLCDALDYAHQKVQIVHRDLKPANLMLDQHGELKVADFGISRSISDSRTRLTNDRDTSGTLAYMSPQQMLGESASPLDDIYSLGATLYDLLSGKPPFYTGDIVQQVLHVTPPSIAARRRDLDVEPEAETVPPDWEATIAACLEKDSDKRPQSAGEVAERLGLKGSTGGSTRGALWPRPAEDAALLETRPIDAGASSGSGRDPNATRLAGDLGGASSGTRAWSGTGGAAPGAVAPAAVHPSTGRSAAARQLADDDPATVLVPETQAVSPSSSRRSGHRTSAGRVTDPFAGEPRRSKLPLWIGVAALAVILVGGGAFLLTRKGADNTATSRAAVVPDPAPAAATAGTEAKTGHDDADQGLAPPRDESAQTSTTSGRAGADRQASPVTGRPTAASSGREAAASDQETVLQVSRLKRQISREMARRDWASVRDDARALLILAPGDPDARTALSTATQKLDEAAAATASPPAGSPKTTTAADVRSLDIPKPPVETAQQTQTQQQQTQAQAQQQAPPRETTHDTPPPPRPVDESDAIRKTVQNYKDALEALDVTRYAAIWVSLDNDSRRKLSGSFSDLKSQSVDVNVTGIDVSGETAAARLHEQRVVAFKAGNRQTVTRDLTMHLKKDGGRWLIVRLEAGR